MLKYERVESLLKERGLKISYLCHEVGKKDYYFSQCRNKNVNVPDAIVETWAQLLETTPEYLRGETDIKEAPVENAGANAKEVIDLRPDVRRMVERFEALSIADQARVLDYLEILSERNPK